MDWHFLDNVVLSYIPHGHCYLWNSNLVSLHAISDALIALAYFSIPCTLGYFVLKRKDLPYPWVFALFGLFIVSCGITHIFEIWTLWHPTYWLSGSAKAFTAAVSMFTAIQLFPIVPQALALTSPAELEAANQALKREIAEHRQAEIRIRQQLTAIEAAIDGIAILQEGAYLSLNHSYLNLFGYDHFAELIGKSWRCLYSSEVVQRFETEIFPILGRELAWQGEVIATRKDGSTFVQEISLTLAEDGVMIAVCRDITERNQAKEQMKQLNAELLRSNQELGQFAYVASHDLQEPLRKIRNFTELLASRYQGHLDETADRYIGYITDSATRMQGLVEDLLSYSRVGQAVCNIQPTDFETVLQQVKSDLDTVIETRNAIITADSLPTLWADPAQMRRLMQNLISNAIKYCQAANPQVHIWATQENETWTISVQDNGIGIDPQFAERIFVIFQRLHNRDEYSGTGIGLAICKKIVERHGGQIWVDSQEGQGSTFSFSLPNICEIASQPSAQN